MTRPYSTANRPRRSRKASGARGWYDSAEWKQRSKAHLARNPWCVRCGDPAKLCDHIEPMRPDDREGVLGGPIQSMCRPLHSAKSREDQTGRRRFPPHINQGLFGCFIPATREKGVKRAMALLSTDEALAIEFQAILEVPRPPGGPRPHSGTEP